MSIHHKLRAIASAAVLFVLFCYGIPAMAGEGMIRRPGEPIPGQYIVFLNDVPGQDVTAVAKAMAEQYGATVRDVYTPLVPAFLLYASDERAVALSHDPRVRFVEQNSRLSVSASQPTRLDPECGTSCTQTTVDDHLWHLDRISHDTAAEMATGDHPYTYSYCSDGTGVYVFLIDRGVMRKHIEFGTTAGEQKAHVDNGLDLSIIRRHDPSATPDSSCPNPPLDPNANDSAVDPCAGWFRFGAATNMGHGTETASLINGKTLGVAKGAVIIPIKVAPCNFRDEARPWSADTAYLKGTILNNGYIATRSGVTGTTTLAFSNAPDDSNDLQDGTVVWTPMDPLSSDSSANIVKALCNVQKDTTHRPAVVSMSTFAFSDSSNAQAIAEAAARLSHDIAIFASANNQGLEMSGTEPAEAPGVVAVGGTMLQNVEERLNEADGDGAVNLGQFEPRPYADQSPRDVRWICGPGDTDKCGCGTDITKCDAVGSNHGSNVRLWAPAKNITIASFSGPFAYHDRNASRTTTSGTSFSAPLAAGVAARFLSMFPRASADEVRAAVLNTAIPGAIDPASLSANDTNLMLRASDVMFMKQPTPSARTVVSGTLITVSASVVAAYPLTFSWSKSTLSSSSREPIDSTTSPVQISDTPTEIKISDTPTETTYYTLEVSGTACDGAAIPPQSRTTVVYVTTACTASPSGSIEHQPQPAIRIRNGVPAALRLAAPNATSVDWFEGRSGDDRIPAAGTCSTPICTEFLVSSNATKSYWARVRFNDGCIVSDAAQVTFVEPVQIVGTLIGGDRSGQSPGYLQIEARGSGLRYQWTETTGGTEKPIPACSTQTCWLSPTLASGSHTYKVTVKDGADNSAISNEAMVNYCVWQPNGDPNGVIVSLQDPQTLQPQVPPFFKNEGGAVTFNVVVIPGSGGNPVPGATFELYEGVRGDISNLKLTQATGAFTVAPQQSTPYWVRVRQSQGSSCFIDGPTIWVYVTNCDARRAALQGDPIKVIQRTDHAWLVFDTDPRYTATWHAFDRNGDQECPKGTDTTGVGCYVRLSDPLGRPPSTLLRVTDARKNYYANVTIPGCAAVEKVFAPSTCILPRRHPVASGANVAPGQLVTLSVDDSGDSVPPQWYKGTEGDVNGSVSIGAGPTVTVTPFVSATYWVLSSGSCFGSTVTSTASVAITVTQPTSDVSVSVDPASRVISTGQSAILTASLTGAQSYRWYMGASYASSIAVPNGNTASISVAPTVDTTYWVEVTDAAGHGHLSDFVTIGVGCVTPFVTVTSSPQSTYIRDDGTVHFTATSTARNPIYAWYREATGGGFEKICDGPVCDVLGSDMGLQRVHVQVTDACGAHADGPTVTVYACSAKDVHISASAPNIIAGDTTRISGTVVPSKWATANYTWRWFARPNGGDEVQLIQSAASFIDAQPTVTTTYRAEVRSECGAILEDWDSSLNDVTVTVCGPPTIPHTDLATIHVQKLFPATVSVTATGDNLTYQWYGGPVGNTSLPRIGGNVAQYTFTAFGDETLWARVTGCNGHTADSGLYQIITCSPPVIAQQPHDQSAFAGETTHLTATVAEDGGQEPKTYQWFEAQGPAATGLQTTPDFTTPPVAATKQYYLQVMAASCSTISNTVTVSPCALPRQVGSSSALNVARNQSVTLHSGAPALTGNSYSWYAVTQNGPSLLYGPVGTDSYTFAASADATIYATVDQGGCTSTTPNTTISVCVPAITAQPVNVARTPADASVMLSVTATEAVSYQWHVGLSGDTTNPIPGATAATINVSPAADTSYWVKVTGSCGVAVNSDTAIVSVCNAPAITTNPQSDSIVRGASLTLSVIASGNNPTYQWYVGNSGDTSHPIGTATSSSLLQQPFDTTSYWVRVTACGVPRDSTTATVRVCITPPISQQPQSVAIFSGNSTTLTVGAASGTSEPLQYQWYQGVSGDTSIPRNSGPALTTPALTQPTNYWARITSGACSADTTTAVVSICPFVQAPPAPAGANIAVGQSARLTATATGTGLTYVWYQGAAGDTTHSIYSPNGWYLDVNPSVTTQYWFRVDGGGCTAGSAAATVNVCIPTITAQPQGTMINSGGSTTLSVAADTVGQTYQWFIGASGNTASPVSGATAASITVSPSVATTYWVRVTGSCGTSVNSAAATVTICQPPSIAQHPSNGSIVRNTTFTLGVVANGTNLAYQWYVGSSGNTAAPIAGATTSTYPAQPQNTTSYWARVSGTCGTQNSNTATVTVCVTPTISQQPQSATIFSGSSTTLSVIASSGTTEPLQYQWYQGGSGDTSTPRGTGASYTTPALTQQTNYWVRITSGVCTIDSVTATVAICPFAATLPAPAGANIAIGQSARVTATATGTGYLYVWYQGAAGDTSHAISAPNGYYVDVNPTVTTQYWFRVDGGGCTASSAAASVNVCIPAITQQPQSTTITTGSSTTLNVAANTAGVTYQWYIGASGNTASPIAGATSSALTVTPSATTSYWARATGTCGSVANSAAATVTLCSPAAITRQPIAPSPGNAFTSMGTNVLATGSNLTYQWYRGETGDTSNPVSGATGSTLSAAVSQTTKYWVRVAATCGPPADSTAVFFSIYPSITQQPQSIAIGAGSSATFTVGASGTYLSYRWLVASPTTTVFGTTATAFTDAINSEGYAYCEVSSGNAVVVSATANITFCSGPSVSWPAVSGSGSCRTIGVTSSEFWAEYHWYRGARGDTSNPVTTGSSVTVCPTSSTTYWCRVWMPDLSCYNDSGAVTVP